MIDFVLNPRVAVWAGWLLAIGAPLAAGGLWILSRRKDKPCFCPLCCLLLALAGPLLVLLWKVFNLIENALGLDSLLAAILNLLLFCLVGAGVGAVLRYSFGGAQRSGREKI